MVTINDIIDHESGEIIWPNVKIVAYQAAQKVYGGETPPNVYISRELTKVADRAVAMRTNWRQQNGLRDDSEMTLVNVSTWGASGDSFAGGARG